ncbi:hypothetical protein [Streptomyces fradiae]|uniref:hypothetical protein n=1 Tax=Streptomyces fradiae TaxID=1906 RepID=UPI00351573CF
MLLVLAALLGAGAGGAAAFGEGEIRSVSAAADPGGETHETAELQATAPLRRTHRRPAPPPCPVRPTAPAPVPVPAARGAAPRSAVMRC